MAGLYVEHSPRVRVVSQLSHGIEGAYVVHHVLGLLQPPIWQTGTGAVVESKSTQGGSKLVSGNSGCPPPSSHSQRMPLPRVIVATTSSQLAQTSWGTEMPWLAAEKSALHRPGAKAGSRIASARWHCGEGARCLVGCPGSTLTGRAALAHTPHDQASHQIGQLPSPLGEDVA